MIYDSRMKPPETMPAAIFTLQFVNLTITQVKAAAGDQVKAGAVLLKARVTDAEKTLETLKKDYDTAQKELRSLEKKNGEIRLTRNEEIWQEAWLEEEKARETERSAWVALRVSLLRENLEMQGETLPEGAGEDSRNAYQADITAEARGRPTEGHGTVCDPGGNLDQPPPDGGIPGKTAED